VVLYSNDRLSNDCPLGSLRQPHKARFKLVEYFREVYVMRYRSMLPSRAHLKAVARLLASSSHVGRWTTIKPLALRSSPLRF
jgi:hypothetical protein